MKKLLDSGNLRIVDFFDSVRVKYIDEDEINQFDPDNLSFFNINTQDDLEKARMMASRNKADRDK
jgi:molybdopterin-guanine dinucleotide biosynthesis protein A